MFGNDFRAVFDRLRPTDGADENAVFPDNRTRMPFPNERRRPQHVLLVAAAPDGRQVSLFAIAQPSRPAKLRPIFCVRGRREQQDLEQPKHDSCTAANGDHGLTSTLTFRMRYRWRRIAHSAIGDRTCTDANSTRLVRKPTHGEPRRQLLARVAPLLFLGWLGQLG